MLEAEEYLRKNVKDIFTSIVRDVFIVKYYLKVIF